MENWKDDRNRRKVVGMKITWIVELKFIPKAKRKAILGADFLHGFAAELVNYVD